MGVFCCHIAYFLCAGCGSSPERLESMESKSISDSTQSVSEFKAQRLQLEGESLAGEVLAESYGQFMETIWD